MDLANSPMMPTRNRSSLPVIGIGLATTALTLLGVWAINQATDDFNIMGWYGYYVIPVGAVLVGLAAGSGYGLASWKTGVRISKNLMLTVVILQVLAYFVAQYIEFLHLLSVYGGGDETSFLEYFDITTQNFAFKEKNGQMGSPMGGWGYVFRVLEIGGFALGGLLAPLILRGKHYCEDCQVYMSSRSLGLIPAGVAPKKIKKKDTEGRAEFERANDAAWDQGLGLLEKLRQAGSDGKTTDFIDLLSGHKPNQKEYGKLGTRITLSLSVCPSCQAGLLNAASLSGKGNQIQRTELGVSPIEPGLNREIGRMGR